MKKSNISIYDLVGNIGSTDTIGAASRLEGMLSSLVRSYPSLAKLKTPKTLSGYTSIKRAGMSQAEVAKSFVDFWLSRVITEQNKLYNKYEKKQQDSEFGALLPKISSPRLNNRNLKDIATQVDLINPRDGVSASEAFDRFVNSVSIEAMRTQEKITKYLDPSAYRKTLTAGERDFIMSTISSSGKFNISDFKSNKKYGSLVLLSYANLSKVVSSLGYNEIYGLMSEGLILPSEAKYLWESGNNSNSLTFVYNTSGIVTKEPEQALFDDFLSRVNKTQSELDAERKSGRYSIKLSDTRIKKLYKYLEKNYPSGGLISRVQLEMIARGL